MIIIYSTESLNKHDVPSVNGLLKDHSASETLVADSSGAKDGTYCIATSSSEMKTNQQLVRIKEGFHLTLNLLHLPLEK